MPLLIDRARMPIPWAMNGKHAPVRLVGPHEAPADCLRIALVNNMPDAALEDTELQFFELLNSASADIPIHLTLCSLPGIPRGERGLLHLKKSYLDIGELWNHRYDGVVITGTEPLQRDLRDEPYWPTITQVLDWAEENTSSTVLSCLAAHAGVLHSDGMARHTKGEKMFGVFEERKACDHTLTSSAPDVMRFPHSRWNDISERDLTSCGYAVLTNSTEAGANLFVKKKGQSLFVHFQGHPEYGVRTLLKEYRRDIGRYLKHERQTYPEMPHGYFNEATTSVLNDFRTKALSHPHEELLAAFPEAVVANTLRNVWRSSAVGVYRNWLRYLAWRKADASPLVSVGSSQSTLSSHRAKTP
jgi:homoserine O-succinyltransferase/O-acetyltransferase